MSFRQNFYYDPQRQGYDTNLWKSLSGTPAVSSGKLRVSSAEAVQYADLFRTYYTQGVNVPATPTNALLTGGTSATAVAATWASVTDGEFAITLEGVAYDIIGIDFTGATTMAAVAGILQEAIRTATTDNFTTVAWSTNKFIITSRASITVTSAVSGGSGTDISGAGATAYMDCDTGHGTVTDATNSKKKFGLAQVSQGLACYFELRGAFLFAVTKDEKGGTEETKIIWNDTDWTANDIKFEIDLTGAVAIFKVNEGKVAHHETTVPRTPLSPYVYNGLADNLDFTFFEGQGEESLV